MSRLRVSTEPGQLTDPAHPAPSHTIRRASPSTGGRTLEELHHLQVQAAAALVLSLIEKGVIQLQEGHKAEAEPP